MKVMTHLLQLPMKHVSGSITGMQSWPWPFMLIIQTTSAGLEIQQPRLSPSHKVEVPGLFTSSRVKITSRLIFL